MITKDGRAKVDAMLLTRFAKADKAGACPGDVSAARAAAADGQVEVAEVPA